MPFNLSIARAQIPRVPLSAPTPAILCNTGSRRWLPCASSLTAARLAVDSFDGVHAVLKAVDGNPAYFDFDVLHQSAEEFQSALTCLRENFQGIFAAFPNSVPEQ
jgi:hypothetical protein